MKVESISNSFACTSRHYLTKDFHCKSLQFKNFKSIRFPPHMCHNKKGIRICEKKNPLCDKNLLKIQYLPKLRSKNYEIANKRSQHIKGL